MKKMSKFLLIYFYISVLCAKVCTVYVSLIEILTKSINHTNKETDLEALHPGNLWQGLR
jgi:hypothetical protein